jgi:hypothetical protein
MMMKKVLILLMVLGITSIAGAATNLTWNVDSIELTVNEVANVTLSADNNETYDAKYVGNTAGAIAEILSVVATDAAGEDAVVVDKAPTYDGWWTVQAADSSGTPGDTIQSGVQYNVTIKGLALGTYNIDSDYYGAGGATNDVLSIVVVPEPITIALLGLGGLLLRRRK